LNDSVLARACGALRDAEPSWLAPGAAADVRFAPDAPIDGRILAERLRSTLAPQPIDVVVQPLAHRRKRLLLADMDSTWMGKECAPERAERAGRKDRSPPIRERAMRGKTAFEPALRERVPLLRALPLPVIDEVLAERIRVNPGALTLVHTMRAHGA